MVVEACNSDLEALVNDPNRSVATLAVSTLLKTVDVTRIEPLLAINNLDAAFGSDDRLLAQSFQSFAHK